MFAVLFKKISFTEITSILILKYFWATQIPLFPVETDDNVLPTQIQSHLEELERLEMCVRFDKWR